MISFKSFLIESRSYPLYHATPIHNVESILKDGFKPGTYQTIFKGMKTASWGRYGVSFARNIRSADWYMINQYRDINYVVFEVDQQKLINNYKIVPIDFFGTLDVNSPGYGDKQFKMIPHRHFRKESEEFVIMKGGKNISPNIIKSIHYFKNRDSEYVDYVKALKERYKNIRWVER